MSRISKDDVDESEYNKLVARYTKQTADSIRQVDQLNKSALQTAKEDVKRGPLDLQRMSADLTQTSVPLVVTNIPPAEAQQYQRKIGVRTFEIDFSDSGYVKMAYPFRQVDFAGKICVSTKRYEGGVYLEGHVNVWTPYMICTFEAVPASKKNDDQRRYTIVSGSWRLPKLTADLLNHIIHLEFSSSINARTRASTASATRRRAATSFRDIFDSKGVFTLADVTKSKNKPEQVMLFLQQSWYAKLHTDERLFRIFSMEALSDLKVKEMGYLSYLLRTEKWSMLFSRWRITNELEYPALITTEPLISSATVIDNMWKLMGTVDENAPIVRDLLLFRANVYDKYVSNTRSSELVVDRPPQELIRENSYWRVIFHPNAAKIMHLHKIFQLIRKPGEQSFSLIDYGEFQDIQEVTRTLTRLMQKEKESGGLFEESESDEHVYVTEDGTTGKYHHLDDWQVHVVNRLKRLRFGILKGKAGTGKTLLLKTLVQEMLGKGIFPIPTAPYGIMVNNLANAMGAAMTTSRLGVKLRIARLSEANMSAAFSDRNREIQELQKAKEQVTIEEVFDTVKKQSEKRGKKQKGQRENRAKKRLQTQMVQNVKKRKRQLDIDDSDDDDEEEEEEHDEDSDDDEGPVDPKDESSSSDSDEFIRRANDDYYQGKADEDEHNEAMFEDIFDAGKPKRQRKNGRKNNSLMINKLDPTYLSHATVLIVDEMSTAAFATLAMVFRNMPNLQCLILAGDTQQMPTIGAVGPSETLKALFPDIKTLMEDEDVTEKRPTLARSFALTNIHRQKNLVMIENFEAVLERRPEDIVWKVGTQWVGNYKQAPWVFIQSPSTEHTEDDLKKIYGPFATQFVYSQKEKDRDRLMIITSMNKTRFAITSAIRSFETKPANTTDTFAGGAGRWKKGKKQQQSAKMSNAAIQSLNVFQPGQICVFQQNHYGADPTVTILDSSKMGRRRVRNNLYTKPKKTTTEAPDAPSSSQQQTQTNDLGHDHTTIVMPNGMVMTSQKRQTNESQFQQYYYEELLGFKVSPKSDPVMNKECLRLRAIVDVDKSTGSIAKICTNTHEIMSMNCSRILCFDDPASIRRNKIRFINLDYYSIRNISLAVVATIASTQGRQAEIVIVHLPPRADSGYDPNQHSNNQTLYTALTRCQEQVIVIAPSKKVFDEIVNRQPQPPIDTMIRYFKPV